MGTKNLINRYKQKHPDGMLLTGEFLSDWGERSGLVKRANQRGQDRFGIVCLDTPMGVFPMLLKADRRYLLGLHNGHNLHPGQRADAFAKLNHALSPYVVGVVDVDNILDSI